MWKTALRIALGALVLLAIAACVTPQPAHPRPPRTVLLDDPIVMSTPLPTQLPVPRAKPGAPLPNPTTGPSPIPVPTIAPIPTVIPPVATITTNLVQEGTTTSWSGTFADARDRFFRVPHLLTPDQRRQLQADLADLVAVRNLAHGLGQDVHLLDLRIRVLTLQLAEAPTCEQLQAQESLARAVLTELERRGSPDEAKTWQAQLGLIVTRLSEECPTTDPPPLQ